MPFTQGRWEAFSDHTDGTTYVVASTADVVSGAGITNTRTAAGDYGIAIPVGVASVLAFQMPALFRTGEPHLESTPPYEQYNNPHTAPYTVPGIKANTPLSVVKGVQLTSIDVIYQPAVVALTTATVGIFAKQDKNNAAPVVTTLLAQGANGLSTAVPSTNRWVTNVPVPAAAQAYITTPDTVLSVELDITTAATGTATVYGVVFNYHFNFN